MSNNGECVTFDCFTHEQVKEINKKIKENIFQKEEKTKPSQNVSKKGEFFHVPCSSLMALLHPWLYECQHTNKQFFGYDIYWHFHIDVFNYNVYGTTGEYGWHIDADDQNADSKLTCLLNLSEEPYEGGEFCMINSDKNVKFTTGMGLILNSLVAHKITPVTKGERITLTYWADGPAWR